MKKLLLLVFALTFVGMVSLISRSGGLGFRNNQINTQSPVHANTCGQCHSGGASGGVGGAVVIAVTDAANNLVTGYNPGQTYNVMVTVSDPNATGGGFQIECLDGFNAKAGNFTAGAGSRVTNFTSPTYQVAEHSARKAFSGTSTNWMFSWTAPSTAGASLTFYASGNAVNSNGGTSGDTPYNNSLPFASLPVVFTSVDAIAYNNQVEVLWATEDEEESSLYLIERAVAGGEYELIGERDATAQTGQGASYRFHDPLPPVGQVLQYRIRQIDVSGNEHLSKTVSTLVSPPTTGVIAVYPNPAVAGQGTNLQYWADFSGQVSIRWITMDGKGQSTIAYDVVQGENRIKVETPLQKGQYLLEVSQRGKRDSKIILIQ